MVFANDITRRRLVNGALQQSSLDQIFCNQDNLITHIDKSAPLGKSDHICLNLTLNVSIENIAANVQENVVLKTKRLWSKVDLNDIYNFSTAIDWSMHLAEPGSDGWWDVIFNKLLSIVDRVPSCTQKFDKNGTPLLSHPWDNSKLIWYRKEKDKAWQNFNVNPSLRNYCVATSKLFMLLRSQQKKFLKPKLLRT